MFPSHDCPGWALQYAALWFSARQSAYDVQLDELPQFAMRTASRVGIPNAANCPELIAVCQNVAHCPTVPPMAMFELHDCDNTQVRASVAGLGAVSALQPVSASASAKPIDVKRRVRFIGSSG
jgi:hypothetical protein